MIIKDQYLDYIANVKFSNGLIFPIHKKQNNEITIDNRIEILEKESQGKNVLHIGCADHIDLIDNKINYDLWLHKRISSVAKKCIGLDNNCEAIEYIRKTLLLSNVFCVDITNELPDEIACVDWDTVILGEIIEHIGNPVFFLKAIRKNLKNNAKEIIITTPNALSWNNFRGFQKGIECVNSDHRFWFTPYTLAKIVYDSGIKPIEFKFVISTPESISSWGGIRGIFRKMMLLKYPALRNTIVLKGIL
jgi:2-polyprenyl-3-methyl-5-hydroxy-6-metoxy-1,4-benzoquinol methylase